MTKGNTADMDLTQGSVKHHLRSIAVPSAIGYIFQTLYNVTDTYFAGKISTQSLASLSLTFSIFFMIIAVAGGMSQGITTLVGNTLGENDKNHAKQLVLHSIILFLFLSITLCVIGILCSPFLIQILGAKGAYLREALSYINVVIYGSSFFIAVFFINAILNSIGNTKAFRNTLMIGFLLNIILDNWFVIGGLGIEPMGVRGIAFATVIVQFGSALYLFYNLKKTYLLKDMPKFKFDIKIIYSFIKQGIPPTTNMLLVGLGVFIITYYISIFGKDVVAAYGIAVRIEQIFLLPSVGVNIAVLAIVSQNNGARQYDRIRETVAYAHKLGFILWIIGIALIFLFGRILIGFFTKDAIVIQAGLGYLYASATSLYAYMLVFIHTYLLQGIKKPALLMYLGLFRQLIVPILLFSTFAYFSLPLVFYWWGLVFMIWVSALFTLWYTKKKLKSLSL